MRRIGYGQPCPSVSLPAADPEPEALIETPGLRILFVHVDFADAAGFAGTDRSRMFSSLRSRGAFRSSISMILMTVAFRVGAGRILSAEPDCSRNSGNFRGETAVLRFRP